MAEQTFNQDFKGYRLVSGLKTLSSESGVYCVFRCTYDKNENTVSLKQLIYIGKADDLNDRINKHEKFKDWGKYLKTGEELCFSYTFVDKNYNERVEAALINSNQPVENVEFKDAFPFDKTIVNCSGKHDYIKTTNVVNRH